LQTLPLHTIDNPEIFREGYVLLVDKPYTWTSFDVVKKVRKSLELTLKLKKLKVGHAGTLDPLATGLVIVCTGKKTKSIHTFQDMEKEYIATLKLGETTPSFDLETEVDKTAGTEHIDDEKIKQTLQKFVGLTMQTPPLFSAKFIDGKRAYTYARKGEDAKLAAVPVTISGITLLESKMPELVIKVSCSKGTYIRALARDIGEELECGAHLTGLRRTRIGEYNVSEAIDADKLHDKFKTIATNSGYFRN